MQRHFLIVAAVVAAASSVHADVLYSNLGPGDAFGDSAFLVNSPNLGEADQAVRFVTPTAPNEDGYFLDSVDLVISADGNGDITLTLWSDDSGEPGSSLASVILTSVAPDFSGAEVYNAVFPTQIVLDEGATYWLSLSATDGTIGIPGTRLYWRENSEGFLGNYATSFDFASSWEPGDTATKTPAFRVNGTEIPEPTTLAALAAAGGLILTRRRRG